MSRLIASDRVRSRDTAQRSIFSVNSEGSLSDITGSLPVAGRPRLLGITLIDGAMGKG